MPRKTRADEERFWDLSVPDPNSGCWVWVGAAPGGYGVFTIGSRSDGTRRSVRSHRFAFELENGSVPSGLHVCHKCDNSFCVNPKHLYAGTRSQNMQDAWDRGRQPERDQFGQKNPSAKLTAEMVRDIRRSAKCGIELSRRYGVSKAAISMIRNRKRWGHIE